MRNMNGSNSELDVNSRDDKLAISSVRGDFARRMVMGFMHGGSSPRLQGNLLSRQPAQTRQSARNNSLD